MSQSSSVAEKSAAKRVIVLGSGNFGSCLADHLADAEVGEVLLWSRDEATVKAINESHRNPKYLKDYDLSKNLRAVGPDLPDEQELRAADMLLFAIPTQHMRPVLTKVVKQLDRSKLPLLTFVNKGIEQNSDMLPHDVIADACGKDVADVCIFFSGPSFAKEIVRRQPTQVSVASTSPKHAQAVAEIFHRPWLRCYVNDDPVGVELAGAAKNVYAIASGIASGLGFENNTRSGIITRSLAEMTRIGVALGARPLTFLSLAGVGDLMLTCSSESSRNFTTGLRLGKGEDLKTIVESLGSVAEGVETAKGLYNIVKRLQVHAPIAEEVYRVLHEGASVQEVSEKLMSLPIMKEHDGLEA